MKILVFSDPHIVNNAIAELDKIFQEITALGVKHQCDTVVMAGDYYHCPQKSAPTQQERDFGHKWASIFKSTFKKVIYLSGNHDNIGMSSNITEYKNWGIEVVDYITLVENGYKMYFGHFMTDKSDCPVKQSGRVPLTSINADIILLGHYHNYQKLSNRAFHVSSCRFVHFDEAKQNSKYVVILTPEARTFKKLPLTTPIPMKVVTDVSELQKIGKNAKVCIKISDMDYYKANIAEIKKRKKDFVELKENLEIEREITNNSLPEIKKNEKIGTYFKKWLDTEIKNKEEKELLSNVFKKHYSE